MPVAGLNPDRCATRNRRAARQGIDATPMRFLRSAVTVGQGSANALGTLPADDAEAIARINANRPLEAPLTLDDVYIHYAEAANSSFIPDRYAFLSRKTLKNIASDAAEGFAFMNSHKTGGLSHDSELPYGRTFAGRYERLDDGSERALIGFYMLRGIYPNGESGPSTDAMHAGIVGGTIFDVSVGLYGGTAVCDICGGDIDDWDECDHVPGTDYYLTADEMQKQRDRGVSDGMASYTIDNASCGETSAVFDGAVPGAGFRKALSAEKRGKLSGRSLAQAHHAFAPLYGKGNDMDGNGLAEAIKDGMTSVLQAFGLKPKEATARETKAQRAARLSAAQEEANEAEETASDIDTTEESEEQEMPDEKKLAAGAAMQFAEIKTHPVLEANLAAGIDSPEKFAQLAQEAADGRTYLAAQREEAKKLAVVAFGNDEAAKPHVEQAHAFLDVAPLSQVQSLAAQYRTLAARQGLMSEDGKPKTRRSEADNLPEFANDTAQPETPKPGLVLEPASSVYERRRKETVGSR